MKTIERKALRLSPRERFLLAQKILASLPTPAAMSPQKILFEAIHRDNDAATLIHDIKRKQIEAWIARDEAEMAAFHGKPHRQKNGKPEAGTRY